MYMILLQRRAIFSTIEKCLKHTLKPFTFFRTTWKHFRVAIKVFKFLWLDHLTTWPYCSYFKNSPSEVIVRNNEGQLFHSYILLKWSTQGNGTPFGSRSGQKRALCIGRVSTNGGNYVFPMTQLTLNGWFKSPTQSPPPPSEKNRDYNANGNLCKEQSFNYMAPPQWRTNLSIQQLCVYELLTLEINTYMMAIP